jgi:hypothetical protein
MKRELCNGIIRFLALKRYCDQGLSTVEYILKACKLNTSFFKMQAQEIKNLGCCSIHLPESLMHKAV